MRILIATLLIVTFLLPNATNAQILTDAERSILLQRIEFLLEQIAILQELVNAQNTKITITIREAPRPRSIVKSVRTTRSEEYKSEYFNGYYESIYKTDGLAIVPIEGTTPRTIDTNIWELFSDIVGDRAIQTYIGEFRVYSEENTRFDAFVEKKPGNDRWVLGVNREPITLTNPRSARQTAELLIHEYAHVIAFYNKGIASSFREFWDEDDRNNSEDALDIRNDDRRWDVLEEYYKENKGEFVSAYATLSEDEDFAETFTTFVFESAPKTMEEKDQKIRFFYRFAELVDIREGIRDRLSDYSWF